LSGPKRGNPLDRFTTRYTVNEKGCWIWAAKTYPNGYGRFYIGRRDYLAHRAAYLLLIGDIPDGMDVLHRCDTPACVNPDHLLAGTAVDNLKDAREKGRLLGGQAKLTNEQAELIRDSEESIGDLARRFGVCDSTVYQIKNRRILS
jgi:hypothetical protein